MERKTLIWILMTVGSLIGNYIGAMISDDGILSIPSVILSMIGGFIGIWLGFKFGN